MQTTLNSTLTLCLLAMVALGAESTTTLSVHSPQQLAWHEAEIGLFFHWAPNVYQGGEGDNLSTPRNQINPDRFDAAHWVQAVKAAHAGYMVFVAISPAAHRDPDRLRPDVRDVVRRR